MTITSATVATDSGFLDSAKRRRINELLATFRASYVRTAQVRIVENDLECMLAFGPPEPGSERSARTYLLIGESGAGKSTILERFLRRHPPVPEALRERMEVVYLEVPAAGTKIASMRAILEALGVRLRNRETEGDLTRLLLTHLREMGVRVLILDESQHLLNKRTGCFAYDTADWLKTLANGGIALVIAGTPEAALAYQLNEQLERRSMGAQRLAPFRWKASASQAQGAISCEDEDEGDEWIELLTGLLTRIPLAESDYLLSGDMPHRLHLATGGYLGRLMDFLALVVMEAVMAGTETIDRELLMLAEERRRDVANPHWVNVFRLVSLDGFQPPKKDTSRRTRLRRGVRAPRQADIGHLDEAA